MLIVYPQGPGDLGQTFQKGAVNRGENPWQVFELFMGYLGTPYNGTKLSNSFS
jgi:hypothetical protein